MHRPTQGRSPRWSRDAILKKLQKLGRRRGGLTCARQRFESFYDVARREFGSWSEALRAAGIDIEKAIPLPRWTPERVLEAVRKLPRVLSKEEARKDHSSLVWAAGQYLGGWAAAVRAAGFDYCSPRPEPHWRPERVAREIRKRVRAGQSLRYVDVKREHRSLVRAAHRYSGGWRHAVESAGFRVPPQVRTSKWTREAVLEKIRRIGRMSSRRAKADHGGLANAARRWFGSWANAIRAAGFFCHGDRFTKWWPERVLEEIRKRVQKTLSIRQTDVDRTDRALVGAAVRHLGGWRQALEAAGFSVPPRERKWTRPTIVAAFRKFRRPVATREVAWPLRRAVYRQFPSWDAALRAAGYDVAGRRWRRCWNRTVVLEKVRALGPRVSRVRALTRNPPLYAAMQRYFGGWRKAFKAAGLDPARVRR